MNFLFWITGLCFLMLVYTIPISGLGNETDRLSLLSLKDRITQDPYGVMRSWNDSIHFCNWVGVTCSSRHRQRVMALSLESNKLSGTISPSVGNLSFLTSIDMSCNDFYGEIPEEFGQLSQLQYLNFSSNSLVGEIPLNLSKCLKLIYLDLDHNKLIGNIPFQFTSLKKLNLLYLGGNNLSGTIPTWVGNYSSLKKLFLGRNTLHGSIPNELGQLSQLQYFSVSENILSGEIPPSFYNITSIYTFDVVKNQLHGSIPPDVGQTLPNLEYFMLALNSFHGPIPVSLSNASKLHILELGNNGFSGSIPNIFGSLSSLNWLALHHNELGYGRPDDFEFIASLSNCTLLKHLSLSDNHLGGELPKCIGNLSTSLESLTLWGNLIKGTLPESIGNLVNLTWLGVHDNLFIGSIPFGVGKLQKLSRLHLHVNKFSGQIPFSLGNLTQLISLYMHQNNLEGILPPTLGDCEHLTELYIYNNKVSGTIPKQVLTLSSLIYFSAGNNSLSGSLPLEVGNLVNLQVLEISGNKLSGKLPTTLKSCIKLEELLMGHNLFHGHIPLSLKTLRVIRFIDFSHNNLTGMIPEFLKDLSFLESLDLSYNDLEGAVPKEGIFMNDSAISVRGNKKLCGGIKELHLPFCNEKEVKRSKNSVSRRIIINISLGVTSFIMVAICCSAYWLGTRKENDACVASTTSSALEKWKRGVSYLEILKSTNGFSRECLIGEGSFGSVYKGVLSDQDSCVAIKVLNLHQKGAFMSFLAECDVLKNIRHRNLIKLVTVCSSIDFYGKDFKALIFEFMPNGSLEQWLHPNAKAACQPQLRNLSLIQRLNISIDVAFGLEYLHHNYEETIVHCDIKPSNILLDSGMTAHVGDFGLARFLFSTADDQPETKTLSSVLKGSIGYIPPEYGVGGDVSTAGDMYSYGILLLEMFTGKKPTDEMFKEGLSLYEFVASALADHVLEIVDVSLFSETLEEGEDENGELGDVNDSEEAPAVRRRTTEWKKGECLVSILAIALSCCAPSPNDRAVASDVVKKMSSIRDLFMCAR